MSLRWLLLGLLAGISSCGGGSGRGPDARDARSGDDRRDVAADALPLDGKLEAPPDVVPVGDGVEAAVDGPTADASVASRTDARPGDGVDVSLDAGPPTDGGGGGGDSAAAPACRRDVPTTGKSCPGSFTVENLLDADEIRDCQTITGNLTIRASGVDSITFPQLAKIRGDLLLDTAGTSVDFPVLAAIGGTFGGRASDILMPSLTTVVGLIRSIAGKQVDLRCLTAEQIDSGGQRALQSIAISGERVLLDSLVTAGDVAVSAKEVSVPRLAEVRSFGVGGVASFVAPALKNATTGPVTAGGADRATSSASFPLLETAFAIAASELATFEAANVGPMLYRVTLVNTKASPFLRLTEVKDEVVLTGGQFSAPALKNANLRAGRATEYGTDAVFDTTFDVPTLETGDLNFWGGCTEATATSVTILRANKLTSSNAIRIWGTRNFQELSLPSLTRVGHLQVVSNLHLQRILMPALTSPPQKIDIGQVEKGGCAGNPVLSNVDLRSLTTSIGSYSFVNNPMLPQCRIDAFKAQLGAQGGAVTSMNNGATCPM